jgi:hypothetical protein
MFFDQDLLRHGARNVATIVASCGLQPLPYQSSRVNGHGQAQPGSRLSRSPSPSLAFLHTTASVAVQNLPSRPNPVADAGPYPRASDPDGLRRPRRAWLSCVQTLLDPSPPRFVAAALDDCNKAIHPTPNDAAACGSRGAARIAELRKGDKAGSDADISEGQSTPGSVTIHARWRSVVGLCPVSRGRRACIQRYIVQRYTWRCRELEIQRYVEIPRNLNLKSTNRAIHKRSASTFS